MIQAVKGMRDFYPDDYRTREWLFNIFRKASLNSGFEFVDSPVLEYEELYTRKAGEEITDQIYGFEDKSGRALALRPEMTPSIARMIIQRHKELPRVLKWASLPQCFRYERMSRGRRREHYQWNLDYLGEPSMFAEAEVLSTAICALEAMGLSAKEVRLRISNRQLFSDLLEGLGIPPETIVALFLRIDKLGKIPEEVLIESIVELGVGLDLARETLALVQIRDLEEISQRIHSLDAPQKGYLEIRELFNLLQAHGFEDYLQFDLSIVRGLAYYTGTVFEFFDTGGSLRAIAGGGRYDRLVQTLADADLGPRAKGSIQMPAVGFGFGDVVIHELLRETGKLPVLSPGLDYYLLPFSEAEARYLLRLLSHLRSQGYQAQMHYPPQKPTKMFKKADQLQARQVILAGSQEREAGTVRVKDLETRKEATHPLLEILSNF
jgi:histidyl-tRNA synthetase